MRYWVDAFDRVAAVDGEWLAYAAENGAPELTEANVLGRSLHSFVGDDTVRHLWTLLLRRARQGVVVQIAIRCEAPERRRDLEIVVTMDGPELLRITTAPLAESARPAVRLLDSSEPRSGGSIRICSWCKRVDAPGRGWCEVEEAMERLQLAEGGPLPALEQGSCPDCYPAFAARGAETVPGRGGGPSTGDD